MVSPSEVFSRLGAPLANIQWSWGAVRDADNAVFLRVWQDETRTENGERFVRLVNHAEYADADQNLGYKERKRHIAAIAGGAPAFAIFCLAQDPTARPRSIKSFDSRDALRLGKIVLFDGDEWATMVERVPMKSLSR